MEEKRDTQQQIDEIKKFLVTHPPQAPKLSESERSGLLVRNTELLLELKRENLMKKNGCVITHHQLQLLLELESNLMRLSRGLPPKDLVDQQSVQETLLTASKMIQKRKR
eukprot:TRINITY_DN2285_c0_g1_i3.p1 TRINITY_DN2285_c0_g1~~TRINITY_DN2285_c0_g1_i3.p1  ORF type:complete len:110 (-),score=22.62 TRINITY_DN2285_c0_g1_i3:200-529(-)